MYSKNLMQKCLLVLLPAILTGSLIFVTSVSAQEINAEVQVDRSQITGTSLDYLNNLSDEIENYLNGYDWTTDNFQEFEQLDVSIQIYLTDVLDNYNFTADLIVRATRPIYNTPRLTTLFIYNDENWTFQYLPNRSLVHDQLQFDSITTLLNFYAYLLLGYSYDSFSALGGTPLFLEAQNQVSIAQTTSSPGWQRSGTQPNNRAQLISDLVNPNYELLRRAIYRYHRYGLDLFIKDPQQARQNVLEALQMIQQARQQTINNLLFDIFFNSKYREIVSIFEDASTEMRQTAFNILSEIDLNHLNAYRELQ